MVREHETGDAVRFLDVGRLLGEGDLDRGGAPGDEGGEVAFADSEEGLVDLWGVR